MVRGAKEELLRSNTPKVTKLEGKKEELQSPEEQGGAGRSKVEQKNLIKIVQNQNKF